MAACVSGVLTMSSVVDSLSDGNDGALAPSSAGAGCGGGGSSLDTVGIKGGHGSGSVTLSSGGAIVKVNRPGQAPPAGGGKRGKVRGMSAASRRRLQELLISLELAGVAATVKRAKRGRAFLITLTYAELPERDRVKDDLKAWRKRLEYHLPPFSAIWVLELQARGVPHFHVLIIFDEVVEWRRIARVARVSWVEITGARVVDVQTVYDEDGGGGRLMRYLSKYLTKGWKSDDEWGRVWGVWNKDKLPIAESVVIELARAGMVALLRLLRRWRRDSAFLSSRTIQTGGGLVWCRPYGFAQLLAGV